MREEIDKWKKENGNVTYTIKELIQALHIKVDANTEKLDFMASKKMVIGIYTSLLGLLGALSYYVLIGLR